MIENHKEDNDYYKNAIKNFEIADLRNFASNALPILLQHLNILKDVEIPSNK